MSAIPKPWDKVDPAPLPETEANLLDEVLSYAEAIASADAKADAESMAKAAALESLYQSMTWVKEWNAANPPKPDAVGRPVDPQSRNRFTQWLNWRAQRAGRSAPPPRHVYRLLDARRSVTYLTNGQISRRLTESALRPLKWYMKAGMPERISEVEALLAQAVADGATLDAKLVAKCVREHKATLGQRVLDKGKAVTRSRPIREKAEADFSFLLKQSGPDEAKDFIKWAVEQLKLRAVESKATA